MVKVLNSNLNEVTVKSFNELLEIKMPLKLSWKISKAAKEIDSLVKLYGEARNKLVQEFSAKDENGKVILAKDENGQEVHNSAKLSDPLGFELKIKELNEIENELIFEPISISELEELNVDVQPSIFFNLNFIFKD